MIISTLIFLSLSAQHSLIFANNSAEYKPQLSPNMYIYLDSSEELCPEWNPKTAMHLTSFTFNKQKINICHFYKFNPDLDSKFYNLGTNGKPVLVVPYSVGCGTSCYYQNRIIFYEDKGKIFFTEMSGNQTNQGNHYNKYGHDWWLIGINDIDVGSQKIQLHIASLHISASGLFKNFYTESYEDKFWKGKKLLYDKQEKTKWYSFTPKALNAKPQGLLTSAIDVQYSVHVNKDDYLTNNRSKNNVSAYKELYCENPHYKKNIFESCIEKTIGNFISFPIMKYPMQLNDVLTSLVYNAERSFDPNSFLYAHCESIGFYDEVTNEEILKSQNGSLNVTAKILCSYFAGFDDKKVAFWLNQLIAIQRIKSR